jgi:DNA-binding MarR family transcriptional regulator
MGLSQLQERAIDPKHEHIADLICERINESITVRSRRNHLLPPNLFSDPAWDILLYLYQQRRRYANVSIKSLCLSSRSPPTTALRYITALENHDLIRRMPDPDDRRRYFVSLTLKAISALDQIFADSSCQNHFHTHCLNFGS